MTPKHIYTVKLRSLELEGTVKICAKKDNSYKNKKREIIFFLHSAKREMLSQSRDLQVNIFDYLKCLILIKIYDPQKYKCFMPYDLIK
jgi:hypothetical protein